MHAHAFLVVLALILAPLGAKAADLVVWWEKGCNPEEDKAVREIVAAFEQDTGKLVELDQPHRKTTSRPRLRPRSRPGSRLIFCSARL